VVIERYHDTVYAELSYIGMAESLIARNRFEEATDALQRFMRLYPESSHRARARTLEQRIAGQLSGDEESRPEEESEAAGGDANGSLTDESY
jgi:outer membrane protein assembly factor BamD (BamD/ComL family)